MNLTESLRVLLRRWYIVLAGLLVTFAGCLLVQQLVPPRYTSQAQVLLMPPEASVGDKGNPFLMLGGMGQALDVLTQLAAAAEVTDPILERHPGTEYTVEPDRTTSAPIVHIVVTGGDPGQVSSAQSEAVTSVEDTLGAMQEDASLSGELQIRTVVLTTDREPKLDTQTRLRTTLLVAGVAVVGTIMGTGALDAILLARRRRLAHSDDEDPPAPTPERSDAPREESDSKDSDLSEDAVDAEDRNSSDEPNGSRAPVPPVMSSLQ